MEEHPPPLLTQDRLVEIHQRPVAHLLLLLMVAEVVVQE